MSQKTLALISESIQCYIERLKANITYGKYKDLGQAEVFLNTCINEKVSDLEIIKEGIDSLITKSE